MENPIFTLLFLVLLLVGFIVLLVKMMKKKKKALLSLGFEIKDTIETGKYTHGHPDIDKPMEKTLIMKLNNDLNIYSKNNQNIPIYLGKIPVDKIKNIVIEDGHRQPVFQKWDASSEHRRNCNRFVRSGK